MNHSSVHTKPVNLLLIHRWPIRVKNVVSKISITMFTGFNFYSHNFVQVCYTLTPHTILSTFLRHILDLKNSCNKEAQLQYHL